MKTDRFRKIDMKLMAMVRRDAEAKAKAEKQGKTGVIEVRVSPTVIRRRKTQ